MRDQPGKVETTLLPGGLPREATPLGVQPRTATRRRPRWDVLLAVALAVIALAATGFAVRGLGGPPPPAAAGTPVSEVVVARSGATDLRVTERLVLPGPAASITLARPGTAAAASLRLPLPELRDLAVRDATGPLRLRATPTGWVAEAADGREFTGVTVDYRAAAGVLPEAQAAVPGRALLVVTPVTAGAAREAGLPVRVRAPGIVVRQAVCVTSPTTQQLCGTPEDPGTARLTTWQDAAVVVLQADLPRP